MAEVIINCPQCQRPLRVTDELRNRLVKCPTCDVTFRVPSDSNEPQPATPLRPEVASASPGSPGPPTAGPGEYETRYYPGQPEPGDLYRAGREQASNMVQLPAVFLLITGALGMVLNLSQVFYAVLAQPQPAQPGAPDWLIEVQKNATGPVAIGMGILFTGVSVMVLMGAIQMLRLRMHSLSLVGTIAAMININSCCCVLGLPIGIWSLIVLLRPEVKAAFE